MTKKELEILVGDAGLMDFALILVWIAGSIAILASIYVWVVNDYFPLSTFVFAVISLTISIPVHSTKKRMLENR